MNFGDLLLFTHVLRLRLYSRACDGCFLHARLGIVLDVEKMRRYRKAAQDSAASIAVRYVVGYVEYLKATLEVSMSI